MQYEKQYEEYYIIYKCGLKANVGRRNDDVQRECPFPGVHFSGSIFVFGYVITINHTFSEIADQLIR